MKYLPFYHEFLSAGEVSNNGLCNSFYSYHTSLWLFAPDKKMQQQVTGRALYWAYSGYSTDIIKVAHEFCPLRQNIVLLMAAMNGEL